MIDKKQLKEKRASELTAPELDYVVSWAVAKGILGAITIVGLLTGFIYVWTLIVLASY